MPGDTLNTLQGATFAIGTTAAATDATSFAADTYVPVGNPQDYGELGDESDIVTFTAVSDGRRRKLKGPRDAGTVALLVGKNALDAGQIALKAAEGTKFTYNFKITLADKIDANDTSTIYYFRGIVASQRDQFGDVSNVVKTLFNIGVNTKPVEVPATEVP